MKIKGHILLTLLSFVFICTFISGCKQKDSDKVKIEYTSLENIYAAAESALDNKYENLTMPVEITLDKVNSLYTVDGKWSGYMNETASKSNICSIAENFCSKVITSDSIQTNYYDEEYYEYSDESLYIESHIKYNFSLMDSSICSEQYFGGINIANLNIDRCEELETKYELPGGECTISEALVYCDKEIEKIKEYIHPDEEIRAKNIIVTQLSDGKYVYRFIYEKLYKGLPIDENCDYSMMQTGFSKPSFLCVVMDSPEHISNITVCYQNDYVDETLQQCEDKFVTLNSAVSLLSDYLAQYNRFDILDIDIKYCCITYDDGDASEKTPEDAQIRPMWTFVLKEELSQEAYSFNDNLRVCGYVDMITGEVFVVDNITHGVYFNMSEGDK